MTPTPSGEQFARVSDELELCYETFGDPGDPTILLIMGLATQMLAWDADFCALLAEQGFHVVRFDNRDCGRSSRMTGTPPTLRQLIRRDPRAATYTLGDLAGDCCRLLDHLGVGSAHVVGASMGGMVAQKVAIEHPDRVRSLTSIMSNTGGRVRGQPKLGVYPIFLKAAPKDREGYAEHNVRLYARIGAQGFPQDLDRIREYARQAFDRGITQAGTGRQLGAILTDDDRRAGLSGLRVPALVIHGTTDSLVRPSGGRATAAAIPGAELLMIEGMGHDLPRPAWPQIVDGIVRTARRAEAARSTPAG